MEVSTNANGASNTTSNYSSNQKTKKQICIVLDTTSVMKSFFPNLKQKTSLLIKQLFKPDQKQKQPNQQQQDMSNDKFCEFALVLFQDYPPHSEYLVQTLPFASMSLSSFEKILDRVTFSSGGVADTAVSEGLAACVQDLKWKPEADKYCFLVCVKTNNQTHSIQPGECMNQTSEEISRLMATKEIKINIICPYKNSKLQAIFDKGKIDNIPDKHHVSPSFAFYLRGLALPATNTAPLSTTTTVTPPTNTPISANQFPTTTATLKSSLSATTQSPIATNLPISTTTTMNNNNTPNSFLPISNYSDTPVMPTSTPNNTVTPNNSNNMIVNQDASSAMISPSKPIRIELDPKHFGHIWSGSLGISNATQAKTICKMNAYSLSKNLNEARVRLKVDSWPSVINCGVNNNNIIKYDDSVQKVMDKSISTYHILSIFVPEFDAETRDRDFKIFMDQVDQTRPVFSLKLQPEGRILLLASTIYKVLTQKLTQYITPLQDYDNRFFVGLFVTEEMFASVHNTSASSSSATTGATSAVSNTAPVTATLSQPLVNMNPALATFATAPQLATNTAMLSGLNPSMMLANGHKMNANAAFQQLAATNPQYKAMLANLARQQQQQQQQQQGIINAQNANLFAQAFPQQFNPNLANNLQPQLSQAQMLELLRKFQQQQQQQQNPNTNK